jgi:hypothetical protein
MVTLDGRLPDACAVCRNRTSDKGFGGAMRGIARKIVEGAACSVSNQNLQKWNLNSVALKSVIVLSLSPKFV